MKVVTSLSPRIVHALPGRIRLHLPRWSGVAPDLVEAHLRSGPGVRIARANALTRNVLIEYDPARSDAGGIVAWAESLPEDSVEPRIESVMGDPTGAPAVGRIAYAATPSDRSILTDLAGSVAEILRSVRPAIERAHRFLRHRGPELLPYLPQLAALAVALLARRTPLGIGATGVETLRLFLEIYTRLAVA